MNNVLFVNMSITINNLPNISHSLVLWEDSLFNLFLQIPPLTILSDDKNHLVPEVLRVDLHNVVLGFQFPHYVHFLY